MSLASEKTIFLLESTSGVNLNASADTETQLFECPVGKHCIPVMVVLHTFSADAGNSVVTIGLTGGSCDEFLGDQTLSNITAGYADECVILMPVPSATPVASLLMDAGEALGIEITTAAGSACTCTADVFGYLFDA